MHWGRELVLQLGRVLDITRVQFSTSYFGLGVNKNWKFDIHKPCTYLFNFEN